MSLLPACRAYVPAYVCQHAAMLLYLTPSFAMALLQRMLYRAWPGWFLLIAPGTICHELAHFTVGWLTNARPHGLTVWPRRHGKNWRLGEVSLGHVTWYNAAPAALAPLLLLGIPLGIAWWRTRGNWHYTPLDLALTLLIAPQLVSFWPSAIDWKIAVKSWPYLFIIAAVAWLRFNL
ncbi:MAG: hypothetical protein ACXU8N_04470 [Telluria sp.]